MPLVRLALTPSTRYVRTARLVSVAVARRAGVADELLDEVRLAVGEACARAVARHRRNGVTELVRVVMSDDGPYTVWVVDACGTERGGAEVAEVELEDAEEADWMADTLLAALVDDLSVHHGPLSTEIRMAWPVRRRVSGPPHP